jgi:hypothetical protein
VLDTDALLLKALVPPRVKPPPWMPVRINWAHPVAKGLRFVHLFNNDPNPLYVQGGVVAANSFADGGRIDSSANGLGMGGPDGAYWGGDSTSNSFILNENEGSILAYVLADFSPTDSLNHYICTHNASGGGAPAFDFTKFSDNIIYFGWAAPSDTRVTVSATGLFAQGVPFTLGGTWNKTSGLVGTKVYTKGIQRASTGTTPGTGNTSGGDFNIGNFQSASSTYAWINGTGDRIFMYCIWSRALTDAEFLLMEFDPYCFLEPDMPALWMRASQEEDLSWLKRRHLAHLRR